MCWNQYVSLNTFVFSAFVLVLIVYNNKYSPYKLDELNSIYAYFFLMSFFVMQLIEFFLWRNLNNKDLNKLFSNLGAVLLLLQPVASLTLLKDIELRNKMLTLYIIPAFSYFIYEFTSKDFLTVVSKTGHLKWDWVDVSGNKRILLIAWLFFLFFSIFYNKYYLALVYTVALLIISLYSYLKDGSFGSLWCWSINSLMLFYAIKLLVILPYKQHGLC
jgi:branched-subunit amino acid ABC-type transport system permease component